MSGSVYSGNSIDAAGTTVGMNVSLSEADLMEAYSMREGASDPEAVAKQIALGKRLGITAKDSVTGKEIAPDLKGLQLIAERRYQHSNQIYTMFSSLLDKMDQMKQRLIQKFGQG